MTRLVDKRSYRSLVSSQHGATAQTIQEIVPDLRGDVKLVEGLLATQEKNRVLSEDLIVLDPQVDPSRDHLVVMGHHEAIESAPCCR